MSSGNGRLCACSLKDWIHVTVEGTTLRIRLGEHAKKVRAGKGNVDAKA